MFLPFLLRLAAEEKDLDTIKSGLTSLVWSKDISSDDCAQALVTFFVEACGRIDIVEIIRLLERMFTNLNAMTSGVPN